MQMPGRSYVGASQYRYGVNGNEKDDEIKGDGNSIDFGARFYDPRLGRWLSRDAMFTKYPHLSPYIGMANNPILYRDVNGDDIIIYGIDMYGEPIPIFKIITKDINVKKYTKIPSISHDVITNAPIEDPFIIDLSSEDNILQGDAFMIAVGGGAAALGGIGGSVSIVLINSGKDPGVYFYRPTKPDLTVGAGGSVGIQMGPIDFNEASGLKLNRETFEGNSQGLIVGAGSGGTTSVNSYADGEIHLPWTNEVPSYTGLLIGNGKGGSWEARYYWSNSQIMDDWSIPFLPKTNVVPPLIKGNTKPIINPPTQPSVGGGGKKPANN